MVLNDEIKRWRQKLLHLQHLLLILSDIFKNQSSSLKKDVNIIWTLVGLIVGDILDEFWQNLTQLLTKI